MSIAYSSNKNENREMKGLFGGAWHDRRALQLHRDNVMINLVDHLEVVNHELIVALLGLDHTPSSLASIGRRLKRLSSEGYFNLIEQDHVTYAVILEISRRQKYARKQLSHKLMLSRFWACAEYVLPLTEKKTDRELRAQGGSVIGDGFLLLTDAGGLLRRTLVGTIFAVL